MNNNGTGYDNEVDIKDFMTNLYISLNSINTSMLKKWVKNMFNPEDIYTYNDLMWWALQNGFHHDEI